VDVDLHQLELRHRDLRIHDGERRRQLIGNRCTPPTWRSAPVAPTLAG
jgi:hypothetical protein